MHLAKASGSTWGAEAPPGPRLCTSGAWWVLVWAAASPWAAAATPVALMLRWLQLLQAPLAEAGAALWAQLCYRPPPTPQPHCNTAGKQGHGAAWS